MKIAFIHYHLKTGGVTTVVRQQVEALKSLGWDTLVLSGAPVQGSFPTQVKVIPELGYDKPQYESQSPENICKKVLQNLNAYWPEGVDVVHVHNPTLAKNRHLMSVLKLLQQSHIKLLCQIHDFAEDGRPNAYYRESYVEDCHYAVLNQRDYQLMIQSGLKSQGCHLLPNAVTPIPMGKPSSDKESYVLYPIRAIRRKNIGEAILLSLYFKPEDYLAITLGPNSPKDIASYNNWREFVDQFDLPVQFEIGRTGDFPTIMAKCKYVVTTSITEGFGFVFLEPWTAGKPLCGRLLPDICQGFTVEHGIKLNHLYKELRVPLNWIDSPGFEKKWKTSLMKAAVHFNHPLNPNDIDTAWCTISQNHQVDFGLLDEFFQQEVIKKLIHDPKAVQELKKINPFLHQPGPPDDFDTVISHNGHAIVQSYSSDQYQQRLKSIYTDVINTDVRQTIDKTILTSAFINPRDFSLLKWGDGDD